MVMDEREKMIITLFKNKKYQDVIRLSENKEDEISIIYRALAFYHLGQNETFHDLVRNHLYLFVSKIGERFVDLYIDSFTKESNYSLALQAIEDLRELPYTNVAVLDAIIENKKRILKAMDEKKPDTLETIRKGLDSDDPTSFVKSLELTLKENLIPSFFDKLNSRLNDEKTSDELKRFILASLLSTPEVLKDEIELVYHGKKVFFPIHSDINIFLPNSYMHQAIKINQKELFDVGVSSITTSLIQNYYLEHFLDDDVLLPNDAFFILNRIACELMNVKDKYDLNDEQEKLLPKIRQEIDEIINKETNNSTKR